MRGCSLHLDGIKPAFTVLSTRRVYFWRLVDQKVHTHTRATSCPQVTDRVTAIVEQVKGPIMWHSIPPPRSTGAKRIHLKAVRERAACKNNPSVTKVSEWHRTFERQKKCPFDIPFIVGT